MTARPIRMEKISIRWTVVSTPRNGTATANVADPSLRWPGTTRQRIGPLIEPTVNRVPFTTRGSVRARLGMSGISDSPVAGTRTGVVPSFGMNLTA